MFPNQLYEYTFTLSPEEKSPLISFGVKFPKHPKQLFEYETFLKVLDTSLIRNGHEGFIMNKYYESVKNEKSLN
ncbi:hypothetical protein F8M41_025377 [Gigaspora margarita]|uniref:Uncharacterized protein n=1 Tax=Gigaspora margarita TaxID=4874 RepID=A0A8H3XKA4_GIGMA|nr:hypothetical protein F8M41_025377 [Gigaspora margarita]